MKKIYPLSFEIERGLWPLSVHNLKEGDGDLSLN